ncbi:hypothetical protein JKP75_00960 [Blastococcus sp. TML/M2B]|uniref:hypothetical protein n=1 Tax=unclassified Blastococcus TaxID=2619396 RepID=UPI00190D3A3A|nr:MULTISPECIES: hypothetical protein [unclassified Blastococcus]MBN1091292.1 hypothetical protein [Blastococcus sp. TML/M2B]MBN1095150.1 hypothetical protein [Blastococcus sp. TML/C7B]
MVQMLMVGLVWLALTAALCLVIGRALRAGDLAEERGARARLVALSRADLATRSPGGLGEVGPFAPEPGSPLVDDEELDRWGELWRWEDELRRGVDQWCADADADADRGTDPRDEGPRRPGPDQPA